MCDSWTQNGWEISSHSKTKCSLCPSGNGFSYKLRCFADYKTLFVCPECLESNFKECSECHEELYDPYFIFDQKKYHKIN